MQMRRWENMRLWRTCHHHCNILKQHLLPCWPASLWVDKHWDDLRMDLLLISFTPTPLNLPASVLHLSLSPSIKSYCAICHSLQLFRTHHACHSLHYPGLWKHGCLLVLGESGGPAAYWGCFGSVFLCEGWAGLFCFKTRNIVVCTKRGVGSLNKKKTIFF